MDITWLGHACFRIEAGSATILTDPYPPDIGLPGYEQSASIVTVSNSHPYHSHLDGLDTDPPPRVLTRPGEFQISGAHIIGLRTSLNRDDSLVAENTAFLIELNDVIVCHMGDLAAPPSARAMGHLSEAQVLLLPAGGGCTLEPAQAVEVINAIQPRIVIPMHYHTPGTQAEVGPLEPFLREMGVGEVSPVSSLSLTASSLPRDTQVVVLAAVS